MHRPRIALNKQLLRALLMSFVALLLLPAGGASARGAGALATRCGQWSIVASPNPGQWNILSGIAAISPQDVWAVGNYSSGGQNLVEQWNGTSWNVIPSPFRRRTVSSLSVVSADSPADIWAAGYDINTQNFAYHTLIEHDCASGNG